MIAAVLDREKPARRAFAGADRPLLSFEVERVVADGARDFFFASIADDARYAFDRLEGFLVDLRGAARYDDRRLWPLPVQASDGLSGLAYGFTRHGAGVDDDGILYALHTRIAGDLLGLDEVEAASEGDDFGLGVGQGAHAAASANKRGSSVVSNSNSTAPVIKT